MSIVTRFFIKPFRATLLPLCNGSFLISPEGRITACTLPSAYPPATFERLAQMVQTAFREAENAGMELDELHLWYAQLVVRARQFGMSTSVSLTATSCLKPPVLSEDAENAENADDADDADEAENAEIPCG